MYVVSIGNAYDGLQLVGPFETGEAASEYADSLSCCDEWHIVPLTELAKQEDD